MAGNQSIVTPAPSLEAIRASNTRFDKTKFDGAIYTMGHQVSWYKALACPCKTRGYENTSHCQNCGGSGWVYYNPTTTQMIVTGKGKDFNLRDWIESLEGMAQISARNVDRIAHWDKIVLEDAETITTETLPTYLDGSQNKAGLTYKEGVVIEDIFVFVNETTALTRLTSSDYTLSNGYITFGGTYDDVANLRASIRYKHKPAFIIVDFSRDTMNSPVKRNGADVVEDFPIHAVGRRLHLFDFSSRGPNVALLNNSYTPTNC